MKIVIEMTGSKATWYELLTVLVTGCMTQCTRTFIISSVAILGILFFPFSKFLDGTTSQVPRCKRNLCSITLFPFAKVHPPFRTHSCSEVNLFLFFFIWHFFLLSEKTSEATCIPDRVGHISIFLCWLENAIYLRSFRHFCPEEYSTWVHAFHQH